MQTTSCMPRAPVMVIDGAKAVKAQVIATSLHYHMDRSTFERDMPIGKWGHPKPSCQIWWLSRIRRLDFEIDEPKRDKGGRWLCWVADPVTSTTGGRADVHMLRAEGLAALGWPLIRADVGGLRKLEAEPEGKNTIGIKLSFSQFQQQKGPHNQHGEGGPYSSTFSSLPSRPLYSVADFLNSEQYLATRRILNMRCLSNRAGRE